MRLLALGGKSTATYQEIAPTMKLQPWFKRLLTWNEQMLVLASIYELDAFSTLYPFSRMMEATLFTTWFFPLQVKLNESRMNRLILSRMGIERILKSQPIRLALLLKAIALIVEKCPNEDCQAHWKTVYELFNSITNESRP